MSEKASYFRSSKEWGDFMQLCILRDIMICEAIFIGRDLIFLWGTSHHAVYISWIKNNFLIWTIWSLLQDFQIQNWR